MNGDLLWSVGIQAAYSAPLLLVWLFAIGMGGWISRRSLPAGLCLIAAGVLELSATVANIGATIVPTLMLDAGFSFEVVQATIFSKGVLRLVAVLISHTLLLMGIFGWRELR